MSKYTQLPSPAATKKGMVNETDDMPVSTMLAPTTTSASSLMERSGQNAGIALENRRAVPVRQPMKHIAVWVQRALRPVRSRVRGSIAAAQINWSQIAGNKLATLSTPERLISSANGSTLIIRGESAAAALIHHASPVICERASLLCGTRIDRLAFKHGRAKITNRPAPTRNSTQKLPHNILAHTASCVKNERLGESLAHLATLVARNKTR